MALFISFSKIQTIIYDYFVFLCMAKEVYGAVATLVGSIIGAGILGIPFVMAKAGFLTGLLVILFVGIAVMGMNLAFGEVILRTKGNHQLAGYADKYLGKTGKYVAALSMLIGIYGALIAYLIGVGQSAFELSKIVNGVGFLSPLVYSLLFAVFVGTVVWMGLKAIEKFELTLGIFVFSIVVFISFISFFSLKFNVSNIALFDAKNLFMPFGVVLFAFLGAVAIPEMKEELAKKKKLLKKAIIWGSIVPIFLYTIFSAAVVGILGTGTTSIATIGLGEAFGSYMIVFANLFAMFAMTTSFLALAMALREMYDYDYGFHKNTAWLLTMAVPVGAFLIGIKDFISTIGFAGSIAGGIDGILIVWMLWVAQKKGDRKPEYTVGRFRVFGWGIIIVFSLGILYQFIGF